MGFIDRLFGRRGPQIEVKAVLHKRPRRDPNADSRPWDRRTSLTVVGESRRQDELVRITGRRNAEAVRMEDVDLELVCEPDNPRDPRAVKVLARGLQVGYLSRGNARMYFKRIQREGGRAKVKGFIGGREGEPIGVRVHISHDHPIATPLRESRTV